MSKPVISVLFWVVAASGQDLTRTDVELGVTNHEKIAASARLSVSGQAYETLQRVVENLSATSTLRVATAVKPVSFLLDVSGVNAFAAGGGRIYVTRGLVSALRGSEGMLAFVVGHEMAHNARQHVLKRHFRALGQQTSDVFHGSGCGAAESASCWAGRSYETAHEINEKMIEQDEEREADLLGMRAAAEAGYHPDYAILAARQLRASTGEPVKIPGFYSGHPNWSTREERIAQNYDAAVAIFNSHWVSADASPGRRPPPVAFVSVPKVARTAQARTLTTVVRIRNLDHPATLTAVLVGDSDSEPVTIGSRAYAADQAQEGVTFELPNRAFQDRNGHQFVRVEVRSGAELLVVSGAAKVK